MLIGVIGGSRFGLGQLQDRTESSSWQQKGKVYVKDKLPRRVPWDWTGYASLDALILYDPDWSELSRNQLSAIAQWVTNGGRLVMVLGTHPMAPDNPLAPLMGFKIGDASQLTLGRETLASLGMESADPEPVACWSFDPSAGGGLRQTVDQVDGRPVFVTMPAGFGRIGVVGFDPANMPDARAIAGERFWAHVIGRTIDQQYEERPGSRRAGMARRNIAIPDEKKDKDDQNANRYPGSYNYYGISRELAGNNAVMEYLYDIAQLRPLSIWWVILLLVLLALLIGPVDYIVLKRLDRLPLTWLTCAGWIIIFTVGAYYGVHMLRAGDLQVRVITVQDGVASGPAGTSPPVAWSSVYSGLFAPSSDDYALDKLSPEQWWSAVAPTQSGFDAYRRSFDLRNVYYTQHDGGNLPFSLPVSIWTMQCLLTESSQPAMPFSATITRTGSQVTIRLTNHLSTPIASGFAMVGKGKGMKFGSVPAGASKEFTARLEGERLWEMGDDGSRMGARMSAGGLTLGHDSAFVAQGSLERTEAILTYLRSGAAVVCVRYDGSASPVVLKDQSAKYEHTQLARLVILPEMIKDQSND
jgi:hypothetical protein